MSVRIGVRPRITRKNMFFSAQRAHWIVPEKNKFISGDNEVIVILMKSILTISGTDFLNFASQARFECLILHFIARLSMYKCWDVIFRTQSKMAARNDQKNVQKFTFSCKYFRSTCFIM